MIAPTHDVSSAIFKRLAFTQPLAPQFKLVRYLFGIRRTVTGKHFDGAVDPEHIVDRFIKRSVGSLKLFERQSGERYAELHCRRDQFADELVSRPLRNTFEDEMLHERRRIEITLVYAGRDSVAVELGAGHDGSGQLQTRGHRVHRI